MIGRGAFGPAFRRHVRSARSDRFETYDRLFWDDPQAFNAALAAARTSKDPTPMISAGKVMFRNGSIRRKDAGHLWQRLLWEERYAEALEILEAEPDARRQSAHYWRGVTQAAAGSGRIAEAILAASRAQALEPSGDIERVSRDLVALDQLESRRDELVDWTAFRQFADLLISFGLYERALGVLHASLRQIKFGKTDRDEFVSRAMDVLSMVGPDGVYGFVLSMRRLFGREEDRREFDWLLTYLRDGGAWSDVLAEDGPPGASPRVRSLIGLACVAAGAREAAIDRLGRLGDESPKDDGARSVAARCVTQAVIEKVGMAYVMRPKRKVIDMFPFNNELEMLDIRLGEMADWVDHFVIVESNLTFSNRPKPLHFLENRDRFSRYSEKIVHVVADRPPPHVNSSWPREYYQRDMALSGLAGLVAEDDLILNSDVDEIISAEAIEGFEGEFASLAMERARFFLNYREVRSSRQQRGLASVWKARYLRTVGLSYARFLLPYHPGYPRIHNAGWHFTSVFELGRIADKMQNTSHGQYKYMDQGYISQWLERIRQDGPEEGWEVCRIDERFPAYIRENQAKLAHLIL